MVRDDNGRKTIRMHRLINNTKSELQTDHINGNKLDNRCSNLRLATARQNSQNRKLRSDNSTGFKGVYNRWGKYRAAIRINGKLKHLGIFDTPEEASEEYQRIAVNLHGAFFRIK